MNRRDALLTAVALAAAAASPFAASARSESSAPARPLTPPKTGPIRVAVVVGEGSTVIDFAGPWEVFQDVQQGDGFELYMVSDTIKTLNATGNMQIVPRYNYKNAPQPHVVFMGAQGEHTAAKIAWIREAGVKADLVLSNCTGAFLLAQTGLLDGLSATTHHDFYDMFEKRFPKVKLIRGPRYVEYDKIATGGGLTSGIELALRVVERYYGRSSADQTAYYMEYNRSPERPSAN
ncbi:MAG TPA: DJ-1/PfpI family protein [Candidatus Eremiobacteraceae bacterium]